MKKLIVANWKMNPQRVAEARQLFNAVATRAKRLRNVDTVLCPPFVYLEGTRHKAQGNRVSVGAQDVFWMESGAYTGEVSPKMLKALGVRYVIIGHSERRRHLGETDEMVNKKVRATLRAGLRAILCIGESLQEHRRGQTNAVLRRQLRKDLAGIKPRTTHYSLHTLTIAYEPIWAIGTGIPETPFSANEAAKFIRRELARRFSRKTANGVRILYGGSVNSRNIFGYLVMPEIAGALVGGASLDARDFVRILEIANLL